MARRSRVATAAEIALWSAVVQDVQPLREGGVNAAMVAPPPVETPLPAASPAEVASPPSPRASRPGAVDGATLARLQQGKVAPEGKIDLHGLDQRAAFATLMRFVEISLQEGRRAILVITGKGPSAQGGGVLRRNVPSWLAAAPFAHRILTVSSAHARHGGEGAFYVLLRRGRKRTPGAG